MFLRCTFKSRTIQKRKSKEAKLWATLFSSLGILQKWKDIYKNNEDKSFLYKGEKKKINFKQIRSHTVQQSNQFQTIKIDFPLEDYFVHACHNLSNSTRPIATTLTSKTSLIVVQKLTTSHNWLSKMISWRIHPQTSPIWLFSRAFPLFKKVNFNNNDTNWFRAFPAVVH